MLTLQHQSVHQHGHSKGQRAHGCTVKHAGTPGPEEPEDPSSCASCDVLAISCASWSQASARTRSKRGSKLNATRGHGVNFPRRAGRGKIPEALEPKWQQAHRDPAHQPYTRRRRLLVSAMLRVLDPSNRPTPFKNHPITAHSFVTLRVRTACMTFEVMQS